MNRTENIALEALARYFDSVHIFNLKDNQVETVRTDEKIERWVDAHKDVASTINNFTDHLISCEDREKFREFIDLSTLDEKMNDKDSISLIFLDAQNVWRQANMIRLGGQDHSDQLLFTLENINEQIEKQHREEEKTRHNQALVSGLSREYATVWFIDVKTRVARLVRNNMPQTPNMQRTIRSQVDDYDTLVTWFINSFAAVDDKEALIRELSLDHLMEVVPDDEIYQVNTTLLDVNGNNHYMQACVAKDMTSGENPTFILGFRDVNKAVSEQITKNDQLAAASAVINALSEEYLTVYSVRLDTKEIDIYKLSDQFRTVFNERMADRDYDGRADMFLTYSVLPEDREKVEEAIKFENIAALKEASKIYFRNSAGLWGELKTVPAGDNLVIFGYANRDEEISEQIRQKKELEDAKLTAEAANDAKSTFLFNMSHDIRTPLNAILGFTELQGLYPENIGRVEDYRQKVLTASKQLLSILNDVLEMARIESRKLTIETEIVDVKEFVEQVHVMFTSDLAKKNLKMTVDSNVKHPYLYLDKTHMTEILMNIISNSVKYTPEGGEIFVSSRELPGRKPNEVIVETKIRDTGLGMSEEFLEQIFEQFSRERTVTDTGIHGTGLGMAIVKRLVDKMDGTIEITSQLGVGTETTICLPHRIGQEPGKSSSYNQLAAGASEVELEGKRILLAEDLDVNAMLAIEILKTRGLIVERAEDGVQCIQMLTDAAPGYYDLILMDIQMPNMNGYEATMRIRNLNDAEKAKIPIIAMTANAFEDDRRKAYLAGMNSHVPKPFQMETLFGNIQTTLKLKDFYIDSPALEEFKQKYEALNCPCGYFVYMDDENEQILYADSTTVDMFGCKNADEFMNLVDGSFRTLIHPEDRWNTEKEIIAQQARSAHGLDYIDYRIIRKDEQVRKVKDIGYKVFNGTGYVYYVYIVDVTDL